MADKIIVIEDYGYEGCVYEFYDSLYEALEDKRHSECVVFAGVVSQRFNWERNLAMFGQHKENLRETALNKLNSAERAVLGL